MYKISLGHAGSPYEWWPMPLDNSGTKMVLNRYGNLITTKDRTSGCSDLSRIWGRKCEKMWTKEPP